MCKSIDITFKGIDDWNRPVYQLVGKEVYVGDVDKLFDWGTPKEEIDEHFRKDPGGLVLFGTEFNEGDPLGTNIKKGLKINIV